MRCVTEISAKPAALPIHREAGRDWVRHCCCGQCQVIPWPLDGAADRLILLPCSRPVACADRARWQAAAAACSMQHEVAATSGGCLQSHRFAGHTPLQMIDRHSKPVASDSKLTARSQSWRGAVWTNIAVARGSKGGVALCTVFE